jgi:hypothetical protein
LLKVANAVGAALSQVSGIFDQVITDEDRELALATAKKGACDKAINAGAKADTVSIAEISEISLSYLPGELLM